MIKGELGVFYQDGEQIGGFHDWTVTATLAPTHDFGISQSYNSFGWRARGRNPWILKKPRDYIFDVVFYNVIKNQLIENHRDRVKALLPNTCPINEIIEMTLEMYHCD